MRLGKKKGVHAAGRQGEDRTKPRETRKRAPKVNQSFRTSSARSIGIGGKKGDRCAGTVERKKKGMVRSVKRIAEERDKT